MTTEVIRGLGWMYLVLALMNAGWAVRSYHRDGYFESFLGIRHTPKASLWAVYAAVLLLVAIAHLTTSADANEFFLRLSSTVKDPVDLVVANPISFFGISIVLFVALILLREWLTRPTVGWVLLNLSLLATTISMTDYDFRQIVGKPDNVPIVGLLFLVGYFTGLYCRKAN
ncbi:MAG: hypothetical protein ACF8TS_04285 [Maioricimonas sp. JB049]